MPDSAPIVFVVDDNASLRRALKRLLRAAGYAVETYASAQAYLARVPYDGPGCVVLDLAMPEIDGLDLQARLAQDVDALPIIFVSGHADVPASVRAMKVGAVDFLTKPVDETLLLAALRTARLGITEKTVRVHRAHVMEKTGARSLPELLRLVAAGSRRRSDQRPMGAYSVLVQNRTLWQ
jgi:FixJ family two-component response regulator